jgi:hypothetical protein
MEERLLCKQKDEGSIPSNFHQFMGTIVQMEECNLAKVKAEGSIPSSSHPSQGRLSFISSKINPKFLKDGYLSGKIKNLFGSFTANC